MSDISVLIQGPLNRRSLKALDYYKTIGPVIISYWDDCDESIFKNFDLTDVTLVRRPKPTSMVCKGTFTYQMNSILNGLLKVQTDFVIRTRSDERWLNLEPLIEKFNSSNRQKIVCGNIFFRKFTDTQYHPGDHLYIGSTTVLRNAYWDLVHNFDNYKQYYCAEVYFAIAVLNQFKKDETRFHGQGKEAFLNLFDVIDINELRPFIARFNAIDKDYVNWFEFPEGARVIEDV